MVTDVAADDFDEADCLCQGVVPKENRIDFDLRVFDEKVQKWRWKTMLRYHVNCDVHGIKVN